MSSNKQQSQWDKWKSPSNSNSKPSQQPATSVSPSDGVARPASTAGHFHASPAPSSSYQQPPNRVSDPRWNELKASFGSFDAPVSVPSSIYPPTTREINTDTDLLDEDFQRPTVPFDAPTTGYVDLSKIDQASMDKPVGASNIGYRLLRKMGWKEGQGLGRTFVGRVEPIKIEVKEDSLGLGKQTELNYYHESSTSARKELLSEVIAKETDDEKREREQLVARREKVKEEIKEITKAFHCDICDKGYARVSEYENHLSSYDHHHRKRALELKEHTKKLIPEDADKKRKREEKEREREQKELERMMGAVAKKAGIAGGTAIAASGLGSNTAPVPSSGSAATNPVSGAGSSGSTSGGWARIDTGSASNTTDSKQSSGWSTVQSGWTQPTDQGDRPWGWSSVPSEAQGGWTTTSVDNQSKVSERGGWATWEPDAGSGGWAVPSSTTESGQTRPGDGSSSSSKPMKFSLGRS